MTFTVFLFHLDIENGSTKVTKFENLEKSIKIKIEISLENQFENKKGMYV